MLFCDIIEDTTRAAKMFEKTKQKENGKIVEIKKIEREKSFLSFFVCVYVLYSFFNFGVVAYSLFYIFFVFTELFLFSLYIHFVLFQHYLVV